MTGNQNSPDSTTLDQVHDLTIYPDYFRAFAKGYMAAWTDDGCPIYQDLMLAADIIPLLTTITVLDLREPEMARYRFCGSEVVAQTGVDLSGQNLLELVPADGRDDLYTDMKAMLACPCGNFSQHLDVYASGKSVKSESLSLPLKSRPGSPAGLLITLHGSEWTFLADAQRGALLGDGDLRIGAEWTQSLFVDTGDGTPGPTAFQRDQAAINS